MAELTRGLGWNLALNKTKKERAKSGELARSLVNSGEVARTFLRWKNGKWLRKHYEIRGMVEVARTRANFDTKFHNCLLTAELQKTKCPRAYAIRLTGEGC